MSQDTAEPFSALDGALGTRQIARLLDQLIVEPLMVPFEMVVLRIFAYGISKVPLAKRDDLRQAFRFD